MTPPISEQPYSEPRPEVYVESCPNSISPYGPPVILGPIVPSNSGPQRVGPQPTFTTCHMCNQDIKTVILYRPTVKTHFIAACLCILGCWPCMCLPYCMYTFNKTDHYCPYCSAFLGSYVCD